MQRFVRLIIVVSAALLLLNAQIIFAGGDPASAGAKTFTSKCASCHGKDGRGDTAMGKKLKLRDLTSADVQKQSDQQLHTITAKGKGKMLAYEKKLTEEQIHEVVAFIRQLAKK